MDMLQAANTWGLSRLGFTEYVRESEFGKPFERRWYIR